MFRNALFSLAVIGLATPAFADSASDFRAAFEAARSKQHQVAAEKYTAAIKAGDLSREMQVRAYNNRGLSHFKLGRIDDAVADYGRAVELDPKYHIALNNRGLAWRELDKQALALKDFEAAIIADNGYIRAMNNRGTLLHDIGRSQDAIAQFS